jgi:hypothetical protein
MAIAACFAFQREISSSVLWDFFDSIGQTRRFDDAPITSVLPPMNRHRGTGRQVSKVPTAVILTYYQFVAAVRPAQRQSALMNARSFVTVSTDSALIEKIEIHLFLGSTVK